MFTVLTVAADVVNITICLPLFCVHAYSFQKQAVLSYISSIFAVRQQKTHDVVTQMLHIQTQFCNL